MRESFNILDLLGEAQRAKEQALALPPEVRLSISPENLVRLKLLTITNVMALADAAAQNPERWRALKLRYHFPEWTQKKIAEFMGVKLHNVKHWLSNPLCDPENYWDTLPPVLEPEPVTYREWDSVPDVPEKRNRSEASPEGTTDDDGEDHMNDEENEVQDEDEE